MKKKENQIPPRTVNVNKRILSERGKTAAPTYTINVHLNHTIICSFDMGNCQFVLSYS